MPGRACACLLCAPTTARRCGRSRIPSLSGRPSILGHPVGPRTVAGKHAVSSHGRLAAILYGDSCDQTYIPPLSSGCRFSMGAPRIIPRGAPARRKIGRVKARAACGKGRGPSQFGGEPNRSPISPPCRERTVGVAAFRELEGGLHHASYTRNSDNRLTDGGPVDCAVATCCIFPVDRRQILPSPAHQV